LAIYINFITGLERLAMVLYGVPDIRLFWTRDTGFLSQFADLSPNDVVKYKPISNQPQLKMDLSFWLPTDHTDISVENLRADIYDAIRAIGGDLVEQVGFLLILLVYLLPFSYGTYCISDTTIRHISTSKDKA
jgi:phenylalanyl-tRNA synthetase beta subunit